MGKARVGIGGLGLRVGVGVDVFSRNLIDVLGLGLGNRNATRLELYLGFRVSIRVVLTVKLIANTEAQWPGDCTIMASCAAH